MKQRKPTVGGNWKMNLTRTEAVALAKAVSTGVPPTVEVAIAPAFVHLDAVSTAIRETPLSIAAQDLHFESDGAFTGEVSLAMLRDLGVSTVLVGHSERRHLLGECDALVNLKLLAALDGGMQVILCVGEKIEQRRLGQTDAINAAQIHYGLAGVAGDQMARITIAYEPVWAIGTGMTATPGDAQAAHEGIRSALSHLLGPQVAQATRIQYGGSVKPSNAADLFAQEDIDGGLIGGASLNADDFLAIVNAAGQQS